MKLIGYLFLACYKGVLDSVCAYKRSHLTTTSVDSIALTATNSILQHMFLASNYIFPRPSPSFNMKSLMFSMYIRALLLFILLLQRAESAALFVDDFDTLDLSQWTVSVIANPYNNEKQYYTNRPENVNITDGQLVITPYKESFGDKQYTSGRLYSKFSWLYGRVDVRAKLPNGYGLWPAIWMLPTDEYYGGWPRSGEIDIMEARGQLLMETQAAIHYGICCNNLFVESTGPLEMQCTIDDYHVYSLDWTPTELVFRLDGKPYYTIGLDRVLQWMYNKPGQPFNKRFHLVLNVAVGGNFLSGPDPDTTWNYPDAGMRVDYVKVYPLKDIASSSCRARADATTENLCPQIVDLCIIACGNLFQQACNDSCCDHPASCDPSTLREKASVLYDHFHGIDGHHCYFNDTAEIYDVVLNEEGPGKPECLVKSTATNSGLCGTLNWACYSQSYADVSVPCQAGTDVLACCSASSSSCDDGRLREVAQLVFQTYYDAIPKDTSCDFGGSAYLNLPTVPINCTDGFIG